jgi:hypothetical protein
MEFDKFKKKASVAETKWAGIYANATHVCVQTCSGLRRALQLWTALCTSMSVSAAQESAGWSSLVQVQGQALPIPAQWLDTPEARIAHDLKLPPSVPQQPQPFDFDRAWRKSWLPGTPKVSVQYFNHLCSTEAGQWILKTVPNVEGLYFARPQGDPTPTSAKFDDPLTLPYALEMPWIQREFRLRGGGGSDQGMYFVNPPFQNYRFVEQPRRNVKWQTEVRDPYVRIFGFTREAVPVPGVHGKAPDQRFWYSYRERTPMQVIGIPALTARYGYTWRGVQRERDREHGISGGELLIYDLQTKEVLAVRRQFLIAFKSPRGSGRTMWEVASNCSLKSDRSTSADELKQFAIDVLNTGEPSKTGK